MFFYLKQSGYVTVDRSCKLDIITGKKDLNIIGIRNVPTLAAFKRQLKTHLFHQAFPNS